MTSRLNQRAISILAGLAIVLLLLLIIFLWTGVQNGLFSKSHANHHTQPHKLSGKSSVISSISRTISGSMNTSPFGVTQQELDVKMVQNEEGKKIFIPPANIDPNKDTEIVKPIKLSPLPLHEQDLIYEHSKYGNHEDTRLDSKYHSGHFRHKNASIWDPHPEYDIRAFGKILHLKLSQDSNFVASDIKFSQMINNELINITADYKAEGCFYTGIVEGDPLSSVAVSLCHGMTGYIRTENEIYLIEPTENYRKDAAATTILHAIHRQKYDKNIDDPNDNLVDLPTSNCDTPDKASMLITDNIRHKRSIKYQTNWYDRRKLLSMRYPKEYVDDDQYSIYYPTEEYNYQYGSGGVANNIVHYDDKYTYPDREWMMDKKPAYSAYTEEHRWKRQDGATMSDKMDNVVEVLIVVDGTLKSKKGMKGDLHHYILTLMSHVALLFKNDTLGNSIRISVVGIIDLDEHDIMKTTENGQLKSGEMLKKFCEWQKKSEHTRNLRNSRLYNVALLLTRSKLCRTLNDCNVLGVANESTMCKNDSCAIVKETGLGTSFTIAHEIGHVLGMPHDGSLSCQKIHNNRHIFGAMAPHMDQQTNPWIWSPCAKHHLSEFIDSIKSRCLLKNPPTIDMIKNDNDRIELPGVDMTPEEQCKLIDPESTLCTTQDSCDSLLCKHPHMLNTNQCREFHHTIADGTLCNKTSPHPGVCLQGKCVDPNSIKAVAGGWGPFGDWGECSMSCGGGIKKRRRECDNPRPYYGRYCRGPAVEYTTCNTHSCLVNPNHPYADAREPQCSVFNGNNFNIPSVPQNVRWLPKYGLEDKNKCVLYCRVENRKDYYKMAEKVKDGTKCDLNQYDICVNGICKKGGCDHNLDSNLTLDMCGNCGGDNSTCQEIHNIVDEVLYKANDGYIDIITIPPGSYNIQIWKKNIFPAKDGSYFYLALKNESGGYILNGGYRILQNETTQYYAGLQFEYTCSTMDEERISSSKKFALTKPLIVQVLKAGSRSTTVHYSYTINRKPIYVWIYDNWTECSDDCEGHQYQHAICVQKISQRPVPPEYCSEQSKPESYKMSCNMRCKFRWERALTTKCSKACEGERKIFYHCVLIDYNQSKKIVHDNHCINATKPPRIEKCNGPCESLPVPQWFTGNWSTCSTTCDIGQQLRTVTCVDQYHRTLPSSLCKSTKPNDMQLCRIDSCPKWIERNQWESCSASCGKGIQVRQYECQRDSIKLPVHFCNLDARPKLSKECYSYTHCYGNWTTSAWGECDQNCYRIRHLNCINRNNGEILDLSKCDERYKPAHAEKCAHCSGFKQTKKNRRIADCQWRDSGCPQSCDELNKRRFMCVNKYTKKKCREARFCGPKRHFTQCPAVLHCPKSGYTWVAEKWGQCENGIQKRKIFCQNEYGKKMRRSLCPAIKPKRKQKCMKNLYKRCRDIQMRGNKREDGEYYLMVRGKKVRIYCDGMNTNRPTEYLSLMSDFNYARFNNTRAENPSLDCSITQRAYPINNRFGHTKFARIRLHIATLKVQIDDFKFATHFGPEQTKMRYATAGDCYSNNNCPKGIFSIYLENTGFQVSPKTKWKGIEPKSSVKVDYRDHKNIHGKCGGYCGSCEPEEPNGLLLEVT